MRRKIALFTTLVMTVLLVTLRFVERSVFIPSFGSFGIHDVELLLCLLTLGAVAVLCYSKTAVLALPESTPIGTVSGWMCTFCGAIVAMSAALDIFCWIRYDQVPPPAMFIYNRIDLVASVSSLIFGILSGVFMIIQGFSWMAQQQRTKPLLNWLALSPVLWMWFRLARYEISYASTIDIRESFFDFAVLVFGSLFFLQLARAVSGVGPVPKNGLLIFALCTTLTAITDAPLTIVDVSSGMPIGNLLIALSDLVIGLFAFAVAILQVYQPRNLPEQPEPVSDEPCEPTDEEDGLAWTDPVKPQPPLEPAFEMDRVLPTQPSSESEPATKTAETPSDDDLTVDELLSEIDSFE